MFTLTVYAGSKHGQFVGFRLDSDAEYNLSLDEIATFVSTNDLYGMWNEGDTVDIDLAGIVWCDGQWILTGIDKAAYDFEQKWFDMLERHAEELVAEESGDDFVEPPDLDDLFDNLPEFDNFDW